MSESQSSDSFFKLQWEAFCTAVQFLTRIPVPGGAMSGGMERYQAALVRSVVYFPFVGGLITGITAIAIIVLLLVLPVELAIVLGLAFEAMLTGAFHEDALADTCDALGGGWTRDQVLEILKDSRLGTYGTLGLGLGVACRFFSLVSLANFQWIGYGVACFLASGTIGRWAILWLMHTVSPIEDRHTQARDVSGQTTVKTVAVSGALGFPAMIPWLYLDPVGALLALFISALVVGAYRWQIMRRVGGSTGDLLGCSCYLVQLTVLLVASSRIPM